MTIAEQYRQEGIKEGMEKGRMETLRTVIINLFNQGIDVENVAEATGLSVPEIERLKN